MGLPLAVEQFETTRLDLCPLLRRLCLETLLGGMLKEVDETAMLLEVVRCRH
jgi:hypothetical protein